jgi:molybdate transport system substrate-binding protein
MRCKSIAGLALFLISLCGIEPAVWAGGAIVIAASPSVSGPVEALSRRFESLYPDVRVKVYYDSGLALRQTIATIENRGRYFSGTGPIHLLAPGGDELITRLQQKYYVLPGTAVPYASVPLVLVVPESLVDAPAAFEDLVRRPDLHVAIADPALTTLGRQTVRLLGAIGVTAVLADRFDIAADASAVLDHLLHGKADVAIVYGPDAIQERNRVRIVATASDQQMEPTTHSMAMLRSCPDRPLCEQFLSFLGSPGARSVLTDLGYRPAKVTP